MDSDKSEQRPVFEKSDNCNCHMESCDLLGFIRITMKFCAMYPLELEQYLPNSLHALGRIVDFVWEQFLYFVTIHIAIMYICTIYREYGEGDLEFIVNCLIQLTIYAWSILMKLYFRRVRQSYVRDLYEYINENYRPRSAIGFTYVTMKESLNQATKFMKIYAYSCYLGTGFWAVLPILYGERNLPLSCWYPFDYKVPIVYEILYCIQFVGQMQVAAAYAASSGFYMVLIILILGQFDVLFCSLKNILATVHIERGEDLPNLLDIKSKQDIANEEVNQYYCSIEHATPMSCIQHTLASKAPIKTKPNFKSVFRTIFRSTVQQHRFVIGAVEKLEYLYNSIWFIKFGEMTFLMCLVAFVSVKSTTEDSSFMKKISIGQYLILVAWELFIICYFGEILHLNSKRCGDALLRSPWYLHMTEMKNDFVFFLLNSQRPLKLTAGKMYLLNMEKARSTVTMTFSFLTLLQEMDKRNAKLA